ncbi:UNVERIFIED_CONTAM: hypothetical protein Slati_1542500 [Sesamum latifolium]|uniref:Uncharacterized protein n=1 Tax=Sesamum latifolium TaxID=2727402 RepID=A0AAW2XCH3_9LAMI
MQGGKKLKKLKKGWVAVQVGVPNNDPDFCSLQRFSIPISYLYDPLFQRLLDKACEVYGYRADGPIMLPCSVDDFLRLRWQIENITSKK